MARPFKGIEVYIGEKVRERANPYLKRLNKQGAFVGIIGDSRNAMLGAIHQFGSISRDIPARPWLDAVIENDVKTITPGPRQDIVKLLTDVTRAKMYYSMEPLRNADGFLTSISKEMYERVIATIEAGIKPDLADSTLRQRLADKHYGPPLVDTGEFKDAITYGVWKED